MNCNFILVLVFASILCCTAQNGDTVSGVYPKHDRFKLVLVWPNSYCVKDSSNCRRQLPQYFTINGFWPLLRDGRKVTNCRSPYYPAPSLTNEMIERHREELVDYWPDLSQTTFPNSVAYWKNQWQLYGSCAIDVLTPEDYIKNTINVRESRNLFEILRDSDIYPDGRAYSSNKILSALQRYTNTYVDIVCAMDTQGNVYLSEIHQCLDNSAKKFIDCENKAIKCFGDPIFPNRYYSRQSKVHNTTTTFKKQVTETHA